MLISEKIGALAEKNANLIGDIRNRLDEISLGIKAAEKLLESFPDVLIEEDLYEVFSGIPAGYSDSDTMYIFFKHGRLLCSIERTEIQQGKIFEIFKRPLIECPSAIRLQLGDYILPFVEYYIGCVKNELVRDSESE